MDLSTIRIWGIEISTWFIFGYCNAFLLFSIPVITAYKQKKDVQKVLFSILGFLIGSALGFMCAESIMSVVIGGFTGYFLLRKWCNDTQSTITSFIISIALFIALGRIGCFLNGCCFGSTTTLIWGTHYPSESCAYWLHVLTKRIPVSANQSLSVHPVQLYETLFLLSFIAFYYVRKKMFKNEYSLPMLFLGSYFLFRFLIEFIRDMSNVWWSYTYFGPLSLFQWFLLAVSIGSFISFIQLQRLNRIKDEKKSTPLSLLQQIKILVPLYIISLVAIHYSNTFLITQIALYLGCCTFVFFYKLYYIRIFQIQPYYKVIASFVFVLLLSPFMQKTYSQKSTLHNQSYGQFLNQKPNQSMYTIDLIQNKLVSIHDTSKDSIYNLVQEKSSGQENDSIVDSMNNYQQKDTTNQQFHLASYIAHGTFTHRKNQMITIGTSTNTCTGKQSIIQVPELLNTTHTITVGSGVVETVPQKNKSSSIGMKIVGIRDVWQGTKYCSTVNNVGIQPIAGQGQIIIVNPYFSFGGKYIPKNESIRFDVGMSFVIQNLSTSDSIVPFQTVGFSGAFEYTHKKYFLLFGYADKTILYPTKYSTHIECGYSYNGYTFSLGAVGIDTAYYSQRVSLLVRGKIPISPSFYLETSFEMHNRKNYLAAIGMHSYFKVSNKQNIIPAHDHK